MTHQSFGSFLISEMYCFHQDHLVREPMISSIMNSATTHAIKPCDYVDLRDSCVAPWWYATGLLGSLTADLRVCVQTHPALSTTRSVHLHV